MNRICSDGLNANVWCKIFELQTLQAKLCTQTLKEDFLAIILTSNLSLLRKQRKQFPHSIFIILILFAFIPYLKTVFSISVSILVKRQWIPLETLAEEQQRARRETPFPS